MIIMSKKILLVTGEHFSSLALEEQLKNLGYEAKRVSCGKQAQQLVKDEGYGLVYICDTTSPDYHNNSEQIITIHKLTELLIHVRQHPEQEYLLMNRNPTVLEDLSVRLKEANSNSKIIAFTAVPLKFLHLGKFDYHLRKGFGELFVPE